MNNTGKQNPMDYTLKTGGAAEKVTAAYQKLEDAVVGGYKTIENAVVGSYQKIENGFVEIFLEKQKSN